MNHLGAALQRLKSNEDRLAEAHGAIATTHAGESEIAQGCTLLKTWAKEDARKLQIILNDLDAEPAESERPRPVRRRQKLPGIGLLWDLEELLTLTQAARASSLSVEQAAKAAKNLGLIDTVTSSRASLDRQVAWLETQLKNAAPQAILVPPRPKRALSRTPPGRSPQPTA